MDLVDFFLFRSISDTRNLTQAAERCHLSLPSVSARIKNLEDKLGFKLLYRTNQGVLLTPAGELFLQHAKRVTSECDRLKLAFNDFANGVKGRVRICTNGTAAKEFLPLTLHKFLMSHPHIDVNVITRTGGGVKIMGEVTDGNADIGIYTKDLKADGLIRLPYKTDRIVLAVNPAHPLAGTSTISFEETVDYDYVGVDEKNPLYKHMLNVADALQKPLRIRVNVEGYDAVVRLIEQNIGIGVLPAAFAERHQATLKIIQLSDAWALRNWYICYRDKEILPRFMHDLVELLIEDGTCAMDLSTPALESPFSSRTAEPLRATGASRAP